MDIHKQYVLCIRIKVEIICHVLVNDSKKKTEKIIK